MREERLHALIVELYESRDPNLIKIARELQNPKYASGYRRDLLNKKIRTLLLSLMDISSATLLNEANKKIARITHELGCGHGWFASEYGITLIDTAEDYEHDYFRHAEYVPNIFSLSHNEDGYYVDETYYEPGWVYQLSKGTEKRFLHEYQAILNELHEAYKTRRTIMSGAYQVKDPYQADLAELICEYFGFQKAEVKVAGK